MRGGRNWYIRDNAMIVRAAAAAPGFRRARWPLKGLDVDATSRPGNDRSRRKPAAGAHHARRPPASREQPPGGLYGALDLGTNNCRLLIATPAQNGFSVVDAFSRIVRLGERLAQTGRLSDDAMDRTIEALRVCANKLRWRKVDRVRLVATEACRMAENGPDLHRPREERDGPPAGNHRPRDRGRPCRRRRRAAGRPRGGNRAGLRHRRRIDRSAVDAPRRSSASRRWPGRRLPPASSPFPSASAAAST